MSRITFKFKIQLPILVWIWTFGIERGQQQSETAAADNRIKRAVSILTPFGNATLSWGLHRIANHWVSFVFNIAALPFSIQCLKVPKILPLLSPQVQLYLCKHSPVLLLLYLENVHLSFMHIFKSIFCTRRPRLTGWRTSKILYRFQVFIWKNLTSADRFQ